MAMARPARHSSNSPSSNSSASESDSSNASDHASAAASSSDEAEAELSVTPAPREPVVPHSSSSSPGGSTSTPVPCLSSTTHVSAAHHSDLQGLVELAQVCHFCKTFQKPLRLPSFTRSELEAALVEADSPDGMRNPLLAELHFKLAREQTNIKLDKMVQDWERAVTRKVNENWMLAFPTNPLQTTSYSGLSIEHRVSILNALCHWKVESCVEIKKYISTRMKEDEQKAMEELRSESIGIDDAGVRYWYFDDGCWIYAENPPAWQTTSSSSYIVEFANAKRIRLSVNFDVDGSTTLVVPPAPALKNDSNGDAVLDNGQCNVGIIVEHELSRKEESGESNGTPSLKPEAVDREVSVHRGSTKVETDMGAADGEASTIPGKGEIKRELLCDIVVKEEDVAVKCEDRVMEDLEKTSSSEEPKTSVKVEPDQPLKEDRAGVDFGTAEPTTQPAQGVGKKRFIIDDDSSDSSESDAELGGDKPVGTEPVVKKQKVQDVSVTPTNTIPATRDSAQEHLQGTSRNSSELDALQPSDKSCTEPENFEIKCESCQKEYDMRYLDPPLHERPVGEWRCFECLVNDARGWPRRRRPSTPRHEAKSSSTNSKTASSPSSRRSKSRKKTSSSSSRSKGVTSDSNRRKRRKSSSNSSTGKKSSRKKHKKKKSSSSSSSRHHHHHKRRYHQEYERLLQGYRSRKRERSAIESHREKLEGDAQGVLDGPNSWRVVCSTLSGLESLISSLSGGSLEQERLRGRLILILKAQEKLAEQERKQQELYTHVLPRRQSSRIALGRMKNQAHEIDNEIEEENDDEEQNSRRSTRSTRSRNLQSIGYDSKQRLALERASRARRRQRNVESDEENDENDHVNQLVPVADDWIDWNGAKSGERRFSAVCKAIVNRLLKEQIADLFSRPVDPEHDGCPDYLDVIEHPIDLGTIRSRLDDGFYQTWSVFRMDVERVWENCRSYNAKDSIVVQFAETLEGMFRTMCLKAEKQGVRKMRDGIAAGSGDEDGANSSSSEISKAGSRSSITKEWSQSSSSDSSESSDNDENGISRANSSHSEEDSNTSRRKTRSTRQLNQGQKLQRQQTSRVVGTRGTNQRKASRSSRRHFESDSSDANSSDENSDFSDDSDEPKRRRRVRALPEQQSPKKPQSSEGIQTKGPSTIQADPPLASKSKAPHENRAARKRNQISSSSSSDEDSDNNQNSSDSDDSMASDSSKESEKGKPARLTIPAPPSKPPSPVAPPPPPPPPEDSKQVVPPERKPPQNPSVVQPEKNEGKQYETRSTDIFNTYIPSSSSEDDDDDDESSESSESSDSDSD